MDLRRALWTAADQVRDRPGVVTSAWPTATTQAPDRTPEMERAADITTPDLEAPGVGGDQWPARALAGLATAAVAGWLTAHVLSPPPVAPMAAALLAGLVMTALPCLGWLALAVAFSATLAFQSQPGGALLIFMAALLPIVLDVRRPTGWPLGAAAPLLGAIGLAGAWPALAGRARTGWQRAALGVTGWLWLAVASSLAGGGLYTTDTPLTPAWTQSLYDATHHVLPPILSGGMLAAAAVWGAAAAVLPWITSGRSLALDSLRVAVWSALLAAATTIALGLGHGVGQPTARAAAVGAVAAAIVALGPELVRAWRYRPGQPDIEHQVP